MRILGLNSSGRDTILTVFADGNKSLFYFYKDNKLISVLDEIKTTSTKGELKIGKDFVIILPNDNSCNEQKKIYIVGR